VTRAVRFGVMTMVDNLERGREAFARRAWTEACTHLAAADRDHPLGPEDLQQHAAAAYLTGKEAESADLWARAHQEFLRCGDVERAARCAFWLASGLQEHHDHARAGAWVSRAQRLLDDNCRECVEHGYLLLVVALDTFFQGDLAGAYALFSQAAEIGERFSDPDLIALARHSLGRGSSARCSDGRSRRRRSVTARGGRRVLQRHRGLPRDF
jgi:hypothetical protein